MEFSNSCPICGKDVWFASHDELVKHIKEQHSDKIRSPEEMAKQLIMSQTNVAARVTIASAVLDACLKYNKKPEEVIILYREIWELLDTPIFDEEDFETEEDEAEE